VRVVMIRGPAPSSRFASTEAAGTARTCAESQEPTYGRYNPVVAKTFDRITQNPNLVAGRATIRASAFLWRTS
jgi:hypothetical protein